MSVALDALTDACTDVAEMADGTVWIGRYGTASTSGYNAPDFPFYKVNTGALTNTHVAALGRLQLRLMVGTAEHAAGPSDAGAICGVVQIVPEGYALALATNALQVWRYSAATWTVVAVRTVARVGNDPGVHHRQWRLVCIGDEVYVFSKATAACYRLRGSTLQAVGAATGALLQPQLVGATVADYFGAQGDTHEVARWRGQWWTERFGGDETSPVPTAWHGFAYHDGQTVVRRAGWANPTRYLVPVLSGGSDRAIMPSCMQGDRYALHLFGSRNQFREESDNAHRALTAAYGAWCQYANGQALTLDDLAVRVHAAQATGDTMWALGHDIEAVTEGTLTYYAETATSKVYQIVPFGTEALLYSVTVEWGTGDGGGDTDPDGDALLYDVEAAWANGSGGGDGDPDGDALVYDVAAEWAGGGPAAGEGVLFITHTDADREANAVRLTTGEGLTAEAGFRAIVRTDDAGEAVTDWSSYEVLPLGAKKALAVPGHTVRVGIIGSLAGDPPDAQLVTQRKGE